MMQLDVGGIEQRCSQSPSGVGFAVIDGVRPGVVYVEFNRVGELMLELRHQRLVIRGYAAKDVSDGAEIRVGTKILIGGGKECIRLEAGPIANGALLLRIVDGERDGSWRRQVGVDKIRQAPSPRS